MEKQKSALAPSSALVSANEQEHFVMNKFSILYASIGGWLQYSLWPKNYVWSKMYRDDWVILKLRSAKYQWHYRH